MCVGVPMRVIESRGLQALCEGRGERQVLDLLLVGPQPEATWVLAYLGAAREVLAEESAREIDAALDALEAALAGNSADLDRFFPGLAGREPALPEHLKEDR